MAQLDFYALREDIRNLVHFIFEETDCRIFESYSDYDSELREFRTFEELTAAFPVGSGPYGHGYSMVFQLWSKSVTQDVHIGRFDLTYKNYRFRYEISGVGLMQLSLGGLHNSVITQSCLLHWNEAGARQRSNGNVDEVNWTVLKQISGKIQRFIRKGAPAKLRSHPILPQAWAALENECSLVYAGEKISKDSVLITKR